MANFTAVRASIGDFAVSDGHIVFASPSGCNGLYVSNSPHYCTRLLVDSTATASGGTFVSVSIDRDTAVTGGATTVFAADVFLDQPSENARPVLRLDTGPPDFLQRLTAVTLRNDLVVAGVFASGDTAAFSRVIFGGSFDDPSEIQIVQLIAGPGTPIPGGTGTFAGLNYLAYEHGVEPVIAFMGFGEGRQQEGVYRAVGAGVPTVIADKRTPYPGRPGVTLRAFQCVAVDGMQVAFKASGDGVNNGIYVGEGGAVRTVADRQTVLPGENALLSFMGCDFAFDAGTIAFVASNQGNNQRALYASVGGGPLERIVGAGDGAAVAVRVGVTIAVGGVPPPTTMGRATALLARLVSPPSIPSSQRSVCAPAVATQARLQKPRNSTPATAVVLVTQNSTSSRNARSDTPTRPAGPATRKVTWKMTSCPTVGAATTAPPSPARSEASSATMSRAGVPASARGGATIATSRAVAAMLSSAGSLAKSRRVDCRLTARS
jgi:hypothetical protein